MLTRRFAAALLLTFTTLSSAFADTLLFSNLSTNPTNSTNYQSIGNTQTRAASDFITGADPFTITSLTLRLRNADTIAHSLTGMIYTNGGNSRPGTLVGNFGAITIPANTTSLGDYKVNASGLMTLDAAQTYWLVMRANENVSLGSPQLSVSNTDTVDSGTLYSNKSATLLQFSTTNGDTWSNSGTRTSMVYSLEGIVPVPEPGTWIGAVAVVGFVGLSHRRRKSGA